MVIDNTIMLAFTSNGGGMSNAMGSDNVPYPTSGSDIRIKHSQGKTGGSESFFRGGR
jgi:hypothetical protein